MKTSPLGIKGHLSLKQVTSLFYCFFIVSTDLFLRGCSLLLLKLKRVSLRVFRTFTITSMWEIKTAWIFSFRHSEPTSRLLIALSMTFPFVRLKQNHFSTFWTDPNLFHLHGNSLALSVLRSVMSEHRKWTAKSPLGGFKGSKHTVLLHVSILSYKGASRLLVGTRLIRKTSADILIWWCEGWLFLTHFVNMKWRTRQNINEEMCIGGH